MRLKSLAAIAARSDTPKRAPGANGFAILSHLSPLTVCHLTGCYASLKGALALLIFLPIVPANADSFDKLIGTWKLESHVIHYHDGSKLKSPNENAYLMYSEPGHVCFVGANPQRSSTSPPASAEDLIETYVRGFAAYCAEVDVDEEAQSVTHHVLVSRSPTAEGSSRVRYFELVSNDRLRLSVAPEELSEDVAERVLVWNRLDEDA
jgi:hypothetical protein